MLTKGKRRKIINALKKSIKHWGIRAEDGKAHDGLFCPLCYLAECASDSCLQFCPIAWMTGRNECSGTPFAMWNAYSENDVKNNKKEARREVKFLQKVLAWVESWEL